MRSVALGGEGGCERLGSALNEDDVCAGLSAINSNPTPL